MNSKEKKKYFKDFHRNIDKQLVSIDPKIELKDFQIDLENMTATSRDKSNQMFQLKYDSKNIRLRSNESNRFS